MFHHFILKDYLSLHRLFGMNTKSNFHDGSCYVSKNVLMTIQLYTSRLSFRLMIHDSTFMTIHPLMNLSPL